MEALKGKLFETIKTLWAQWESELNPHRVDEYSNTKKYVILYRTCKKAINLLDKQLTKANSAPSRTFEKLSPRTDSAGKGVHRLL